MLQLNTDNYHSKEANNAYMSVSLYKQFLSCEAATMAYLRDEYQPVDKKVFLIGRYLHSWAEGKLQEFMEQNKEFVFKQRGGGKYAEFEQVDEMIRILSLDQKVLWYLNGTKELIITANMFGVPWKVRLDIYNPELNYIADLKTTKSISEFTWSREHGRRVSFIEEWGYMIQAAVYSEVERLARGRTEYRDFYLIAVSKEKVPDHAIIDLTDPARMQEELQKISERLPRIIAVKSGQEKPTRCEHCDHCKATKRVGNIIHYTEMMEAI